MKLHISHLPRNETAESFARKFGAYIAERDEHAQTEGVPAPFPEHEIFRGLYERGHRAVEFDAHDLAVREVMLANVAEEAARRTLQEHMLLIRHAKRADASDAVKAAAAALPRESHELYAQEEEQLSVKQPQP